MSTCTDNREVVNTRIINQIRNSIALVNHTTAAKGALTQQRCPHRELCERSDAAVVATASLAYLAHCHGIVRLQLFQRRVTRLATNKHQLEQYTCTNA